MATDDDIDVTLKSIAAAGFKVVRTWAFNDVSSKPTSGPYFQVCIISPLSLSYGLNFYSQKILQGGKAVINDGTDGLQRLDKVVATADKYGIKLLFSLTNNWNPERPMPSTPWNRRANADELPRGYLANDYGTLHIASIIYENALSYP